MFVAEWQCSTGSVAPQCSVCESQSLAYICVFNLLIVSIVLLLWTAHCCDVDGYAAGTLLLSNWQLLLWRLNIVVDLCVSDWVVARYFVFICSDFHVHSIKCTCTHTCAHTVAIPPCEPRYLTACLLVFLLHSFLKRMFEIIMAAIWNKAGHYIFALWFLLVCIFFLYFLA